MKFSHQEICISSTTSQVIRSRSAGNPARFSKRLTRQFTRTKRARRRTLRYSLIAGNFAILAVVAVAVASSGGDNPTAHQSASAAPSIAAGEAVGPLDQISSVDVAVNVARSAGLPESVAVANQSDSTKIMNAITPADTAVVSKPQVVATNTKTGGDIQTYVVKAGDTVPSIAAQFNITSDSIKWSNELRSDTVIPGTELAIPPITGIVYTVLIGDTPDSVAQKFRASKEQLVAFNDAEVNGLQPGQRIVVPNGQKAAAGAVGAGVAAGVLGSVGSFSATYGYNGYDPGWCTWYAASRVSVPNNWGNANTWDNLARVSGWTVSSVPRIGAVAQTDRGSMGHVGIVEDVRQAADGSWEIKYSDMNGLAGFNRVGYSGWVPALSKFQNFIYR